MILQPEFLHWIWTGWSYVMWLISTHCGSQFSNQPIIVVGQMWCVPSPPLLVVSNPSTVHTSFPKTFQLTWNGVGDWKKWTKWTTQVAYSTFSGCLSTSSTFECEYNNIIIIMVVVWSACAISLVNPEFTCSGTGRTSNMKSTVELYTVLQVWMPYTVCTWTGLCIFSLYSLVVKKKKKKKKTSLSPRPHPAFPTYSHCIHENTLRKAWGWGY